MRKRYFSKAWFPSEYDEGMVDDAMIAAPITVYSPEDATVNTGLVDHLGNPILYVEEYNPIGFFAEIHDPTD